MGLLRRLKTFLGIQTEPRRCNTLRGNFILKYSDPIENDYFLNSIDAPIGKGSFGVVVKGTNLKSGRDFAIKVVSKEGNLARIQREVQLLTDIDHVNIIRLFSVYESDEEVSFVFALCLGGHLGNLLNRTPNKYLPEDTTKLIVRQLASAVAHLHSVGICHRDIKLQNILLEAGDEAYPQIKLIDFGFACRYPGVLPLTTRCGTAYCTAPEVFRENYDERCDVWSISVVTYALLCGHKPFSSVEIPGAAQSGKAAVVTNILMGRYHFNYFPFKKVSSEGIEFIEKLFEPNYHARCTACQVLNLPWLLSASSGPPAAAMTLKNTPLSSAISTLCRKGTHSKIGNTGMVAVAFSSTDDGCPELRTIFQRFDKENNGFLSLKEFRNVMKSINDSLANKDIDTLFKAIDVDNDKQISFTEFLAATLDPRQVDTQEVNKAFQLLDCDNKGYLTVDDFYRVLAVTPEKYKLLNLSKGLSRSDSDEISDIVSQDTASESFQNEREKDKLLKKILEMITAADANKDGVISYSEFLLGVMGAETTEEMDAFDQASNAFNISKTAGKNSAILSQRSDAFFAKLYGPKVSSGNRHQSHPTMRVSGIQSLRKSFSNCELNSPKYSTVHCGDYTDTPSKRMASSQSEPDRLSDLAFERLSVSAVAPSSPRASQDQDNIFSPMDI